MQTGSKKMTEKEMIWIVSPAVHILMFLIPKLR